MTKPNNEKADAFASAFSYEMEDWMKRSYCLLQVIRYPLNVNKHPGFLLKKY